MLIQKWTRMGKPDSVSDPRKAIRRSAVIVGLFPFTSITPN